MLALRMSSVLVAALVWTAEGAALERGEFRGEAQQVNAATDFDVLRPRVAVSATGDTVVGWLELARTGNPPAAQGRVRFYRADGTARGAQQNLYFGVPDTSYSDTVVGIDGAGVSTAVWMSQTSATEPGSRLLFRRYSPVGAALGPATSIELGIRASLGPEVAVAPDGRAIIVWSEGPDEGVVEVRAIRLDSDGATVAAPAPVVSIGSTGEVPRVRIGIDDSGDAVIVWVFADDLFWRRLPLNGPPGPVGQVNVASGARAADLAVDGTGAFIVTWVGETADRVLRRRYDATGAPLEGETEVFAGTVDGVSVDVDADGDAVIIWAAQSFTELFAQSFDASGAATAPGVVVAAVDGASVEGPDVALDADGDAVIAWQLTTRTDEADRNAFIRRMTGPADVDLAIAIDDGASGAPGSSEGRYEVTVTNTRMLAGPGIGQADGVLAQITLPAGHSLIDVETDGWQCSGTATLRCVPAASLPAGDERSLVLRLLRPDTLCLDAEARASVTSQQFDSVGGNDTLADNTWVGAPGTVSVVATARIAPEPDAEVLIEVRRDDGCVGDLDVSFVTEALTAEAGTDFGGGGSFVFPEGASRASFAVSIVNDAIEEADEAFDVVLTGADGGGAVVAPNRTTVTIADDESRGGGGGAMPATLLWLLVAAVCGRRRLFVVGRTSR